MRKYGSEVIAKSNKFQIDAMICSEEKLFIVYN